MNDIILTEKMWHNITIECASNGYRSNQIKFIETIGEYYYTGGYGVVRFNTPELKTFYLLKWS